MTKGKRADPTLSLPGESDRAQPTRLIIAPGTASERRLSLDRLLDSGGAVVGSDPSADIVIDDPHVSARHVELERTPAGIRIRDLGSKNGTKIQGAWVESAFLDPGVVVTIGTTHMLLEGEFERARTEHDGSAAGPTRFGSAIAASSVMRDVFALLERLAPTDLTLTLLGETGTGKDVLARAIHDRSERSAGPFVVFDCGAVAATLIESQLFGHVRGAFTGATDERPGAFERANRGTLFLDEIGELAIDLQPKLLRVLEQRRVTRLGSDRELPIDVRILCATNRDLEAEVSAGNFRQDLFFRINQAVVHLPPLRERPGDLVALVNHFAADLGIVVSPEAMAVLAAGSWPGNVRELRNVLRSAAAVSDGHTLRPADFMSFAQKRRQPTLQGLPLAGRSLESIESAAIAQTLDRMAGNRTHAAKALGIAPSTLYAKMKKYRLD